MALHAKYDVPYLVNDHSHFEQRKAYFEQRDIPFKSSSAKEVTEKIYLQGKETTVALIDRNIDMLTIYNEGIHQDVGASAKYATGFFQEAPELTMYLKEFFSHVREFLVSQEVRPHSDKYLRSFSSSSRLATSHEYFFLESIVKTEVAKYSHKVGIRFCS